MTLLCRLCVCSDDGGRIGLEARAGALEPTRTILVTAGPSVCAEQLARFFPEAQRVQATAEIRPVRHGWGQVKERVVVEYASAQQAIFRTQLPLEFGDRVRLERAGEAGEYEATVVAVQYDEGRKAIAVKFAGGTCEWVKKL